MREPAHVPVWFRPPSWRPSHFLCLPKESNQRKAPSRSRSRGHPCPRDCASRFRGLRTVRPCTGRKLAAILAAIAARLFLHLLAATWRGPGKSRARQSLPQKLTDSSSPRRRGPSAFAVAPLLISGPSVKRRRSAGQGRVPRTRGGPGRPAFGDRAGSPAAKPRPTAANRRLRRRRVTEGAFLWLLSLCKQRK